MERRSTYRNRRLPTRNRPLPTIRRGRRPRKWQWLAAVLVLGAFGYFLYWLTGDDVSDAPAAPPQQSEKLEPKPKSPAKPKSGPATSAAQPKPKEEPRFTFYTLLPEKEITIPEGEIRARKRAEILGRTKPEDYFIQVGSFHSPEDARRIQTELGRLGVKARLEQTEIGKVLWYRVRIGPFKTLREVEAIRARLRGHRIDSIVQTVKR